jgi:hypothetical protein
MILVLKHKLNTANMFLNDNKPFSTDYSFLLTSRLPAFLGIVLQYWLITGFAKCEVLFTHVNLP